MIFDYETLKLIWWGLIGALLIGFAITDGMDMGVGTLLPFVAKNDDERRVVINTVAPHWEGNQVWFVTAGGALFAAWPTVYATAFSGFYFAMMLLLFALFLRPVGFDYRSKIEHPKWRSYWDWALFAGSAIPALVFGIAFGNLLQGVPFSFDEYMRPTYTGSFFSLLNPYALLCGLISVASLAVQGGTWLQLRADPNVAERAANFTRKLALGCSIGFVVAGLWLAIGIDGYVITSHIDGNTIADPLQKQVALQSGAWLNNYALAPWTLCFPLLGILLPLAVILLSKAQRHGWAYLCSSLSLSSLILTAGAAMFPFVMPSSSEPNHSLTLWDAVSSHMTLNIMFIVVCLLLPVVLGYTLWCHIKMWRRITVQEIRDNSHSVY